MSKRLIFISVIALTFAVVTPLKAATLGESQNFNIEPAYDLSQREQLTATLVKISSQLYWYADSNWWNSFGSDNQSKVQESLNNLTEEFEYKIYPILTSTFGQEWTPGIDKDTRITILVHPMKEDAGGYFNSGDEYPKAQSLKSNEREMIYLNSQFIDSSQEKSFLAHEFTHLISFNQKERRYGISEETWLNEARAEYASTLVGYDQDYQGSNLDRRVKNFLDKPYDSLTEWKNKNNDYGVINLFTQYLVDHYGIDILANSLKMQKTGIASLNSALSQKGFADNFSQIFTNWTIAVLVNDCSLGQEYCYLNQNLKNFKVVPLTNYLPLMGDSTLSVTTTTTDWAGNWHKFIGGWGNLRLEFTGAAGVSFKISYVIQDAAGKYSVNFLSLDSNQKGSIFVPDFGTKSTSLTIIPSVQSKTANFTGQEPLYTFFWSASIKQNNNSSTPSQNTEALLAQIESLKKQIASLQAQIQAILNKGQNCQAFSEDLYFGLMNDNGVKCLQEFLASQGTEIYPEGLITGNFLGLTQQAVIRFQEKYASDILNPLGLTNGSGYVGLATRSKINQIRGY